MKMDLNNFVSWVNAAKHGDNIIYHTGCLAIDRQPIITAAGKEIETDLSWVASRAMTESDAGRLALTQRKLGHLNYDYVATKIIQPPRGNYARG